MVQNIDTFVSNIRAVDLQAVSHEDDYKCYLEKEV